MVQAKNTYKTLVSRHGKLSIQDEEKKRNLPQATYLLMEQELLNKYFSIGTEKKKEYVSHEEFDELREEVNNLKEQLRTVNNSKNLALKEAYKCLNKIVEIKEIDDLSGNDDVALRLVVTELSRTLFRKIADVEISLARKFADVHIDIQPVLAENAQMKNCEVDDESSNSTESKA